MKKPFVLLVLSVLLSACGGDGSNNDALVAVRHFEGGTLYRTNPHGNGGHFNVLELRGDYKQMGRQYGGLLKAELQEFYRAMMNGRGESQYEQIKQVAFKYYDKYSSRYQHILLGLSETSGLSFEQQVIFNLNLLVIAEGEAGCSGMGVWDAYSADGRMVFGRNWDLNKGLFKKYAPYLTVVVYNPTDGGNSVADINYAGSVVFQSGMNSRGIFMDFQNGTMADPSGNEAAPDTNTSLLSFLFDESDIEGVTRAFERTSSEGGAIVNVAVVDEAYSFEWPSYGMKRRNPDAPGVLAETNHFVDPGWKNLPPLPPDPLHSGYTRERRANLLAMAEHYKGTIDKDRMMNIFETTIPEGGPTFPLETPAVETVYQMVALPGQDEIYLRAVGSSSWERIDLGPLFNR